MKSITKKIGKIKSIRTPPAITPPKYLYSETYKWDTFYNGYRPLLSPVREQLRKFQKEEIEASSLSFEPEELTAFNYTEYLNTRINTSLIKQYPEFKNLPQSFLNNFRPFKKPTKDATVIINIDSKQVELDEIDEILKHYEIKKDEVN